MKKVTSWGGEATQRAKKATQRAEKVTQRAGEVSHWIEEVTQRGDEVAHGGCWGGQRAVESAATTTELALADWGVARVGGLGRRGYELIRQAS